MPIDHGSRGFDSVVINRFLPATATDLLVQSGVRLQLTYVSRSVLVT